MDYLEAKSNVDSLSRFGSVLGLNNMYELLGRLDNPQDKIKVIHVAGTNGKGSTIAYLSSILAEAGYKVGKYTSPVVFEYLEKYQINNKNISESDFTVIAEKVLNAVEQMSANGKGQPTIFEVETAMAYLYFYESNCDVAIIETGMGGDLDATNVCKKVLASVIVSISLDHVGILGDSLCEIATHKAGIIKKGCPVVLYGQSDEVVEVISNVANDLKAPLTISKTDINDENPYRYKTANGFTYEDLKPSLRGGYQLKNLSTALEVVEILKTRGFDISKRAVERGVSTAVWHGRFEVINDNPLFIIDGAHNPGAVRELKTTIEGYYPEKKWIFIMGVLADKDFNEEAKILKRMAEAVITVTPNNTRALGAKDLLAAVKKAGIVVKTKDGDDDNLMAAANTTEAIKLAIKKSCKLGEEAGILAFGSLSYLCELKSDLESYLYKYNS